MTPAFEMKETFSLDKQKAKAISVSAQAKP
jgi:hypothetical protein